MNKDDLSEVDIKTIVSRANKASHLKLQPIAQFAKTWTQKVYFFFQKTWEIPVENEERTKIISSSSSISGEISGIAAEYFYFKIIEYFE